MAKTTIKNLVSLILEQIDMQAELDQTFPPDQYVFVENIFDYPELFQDVQDVQQPDDKIRQLQPEPEAEYEPELAMVAEGELQEMARGWIFDKRELTEALRIPANMMIRSPKSVAKMPDMPRIVCLDPDTNEFVEGVAIGNLLMITPSGHEVLVFDNYGLEEKIDRQKKQRNFCVLKDTWEDDEGRVQEVEKIYMRNNVRGEKYGRSIERDPQAVLRDQIANEEDPTKKKELELRLDHILDGNAKRYGLFVPINQLFDSPEILNHLDSALIPETWATPKRTEGTWVTIQKNKVGGTTPEIDINFVSVKDFKSVEDAMEKSMQVRMDLATEEERDMKNRDASQQMTRSHGGNAYAGGLWSPGQRVADLENFIREGGKTRVYELLSKAIQEGEKTVTVGSDLHLVGDVEGDEYVMSATFSANMYDRGGGRGRLTGPLFDPITVGMRKKLPAVDDVGDPVDPENFTLEGNTKFFVNEGRTSDNTVRRTGVLPSLLKNLGKEIINQVDPDEVVATMIQLIQNAVDIEPEENI